MVEWYSRLQPHAAYPSYLSRPNLANQIEIALSVHLCTQGPSQRNAQSIVMTEASIFPNGRPEKNGAPINFDLCRNNLLRALRPDDLHLLESHMDVVESAAGDLLYNPGDDVGVVYFPCGPSLVAYLVENEDGRDVETILVGREGAVGGIVSSGHLPAYCRIVVKFGGPFMRIPVRQLEIAKSQSLSLRMLFARYADCMLAQIFQSTACNAIHTIEQRTAKWIISTMDRTGDTIIPLTQEQLASMLGVGRSYASRVIQTFKHEGILETSRGALQVRDREALNARSCMCNDSIRRHFDDVLRGVYPAE